MNERVRASLQRHATWLAAMMLHIGLLWLILHSTINRAEPPPSDAVEVAMIPPPKPPAPKPPVQPPKPVRAKPAARLAETESSAARPRLRPAPRLDDIEQPPIDLALPDPLLPRSPMALPAGSAAAGAPSNGSGRNGAGAGTGSREGNDYLIRLKAYIDAHKGRARHREPHDAEVALVLDQSGILTDIRIVASSGDPAVDEEIMTQLRQMSPFPQPPAVLFSPSKTLLSVADKWIFPRP
jgi:protein TonB